MGPRPIMRARCSWCSDRAPTGSVVEHAPGGAPPPPGSVVEFAYLTGWRIPSEVLRLTWAQVDFQAGVVRLEPRGTKNDEGRTFPFDALPALKTLLEAQRARTTDRKSTRLNSSH